MILTITNNGDGTGGVINVSANVGTATIYISRFTGDLASLPFASIGTVSGNGSLAYATTNMGPHFAIGVNGSTISNPVSFRLTDATNYNPQYQLMEAVRDYMIGLALPSVSTNPDHHVLSKLPYRSNQDLAIDSVTDTCVWYFPKSEVYTNADTERNTIAYPVQVLLVRQIGSQTHKGLYDMLATRWIMGGSMSQRPFAGYCGFYNAELLPGEPYNPEHWKNGYDVSSVVIRGFTEQESGVF